MQPIQPPQHESEELRSQLEQLQKENEQLKQDIKQLKQADRSTSEEIQKLDLALRNTVIGEWEFDVQTKTYIASERRVGMLGFAIKEIGTHFPMEIWAKWVHPDDIENVLQAANEIMLKSGEFYESQARLLNAEGEWRWTITRGFCIEWDADGNPLRYIGITIDIDEQVRTQQQVAELQLEHERAKILARFITQASHEFRTPLSIMNTNLYLLDKTVDDEARENRIALIQNQIRYLESLVKHLNEMAELDSVEELESEQVDLALVVKEILIARATDLEAKHIEVASRFNPKPMLMEGHYQYLCQVVDCILDNAIKFCEEKGTITIIGEKPQNTVIFKIIDDGVGIESEHLQHVTKRFYRVDQAGTSRGFGLGLAMAKRIIELHHGQLEVESQAKHGTSVTIRIPAQ